MFSLWKEPSNEIEVEGKVYTYDASFDTALAIIELLNEKNLSLIDKHEITIELLFDDRVDDLSLEEQNKLIKEVFKHHFNNGEELEKRDIHGNIVPTPKTKNKRFMSFVHDAKYIYAAFMQVYHIDLYDQCGIMHWHTFLALLDGLTEDTQFIKIVNIRRWKKPSKTDTEEKRYKELKREFALPEEEEVD